MDNATRTLAVLAVEPMVSALSLDRIKAVGERVPGVVAVRVDAHRGRIHVLYNGTAETIEQVEDAVRIPGHTLRLLGNSQPLPKGIPDDQ